MHPRSLPGHSLMRVVVLNGSKEPVDLHVDQIDVVGPHRRPAVQFDTANAKHAHLEPGETVALTVAWRGEPDTVDLRYANIPLEPKRSRF